MMDQKCPSMDYFLYKGDHPYHVIINKGPYKSWLAFTTGKINGYREYTKNDGVFCMLMSDPCSMVLESNYHYSYSKSKRIGLDSHDLKYYDQIITKLNLQARDKQHQRNSNSMQGILQEQTAISSRSKKRKRVLLVDDEPDICMAYQIALEDAGYECVSCTDSVKALQEFRPAYYDLILLDIKMPILNGFELGKKIRAIDNIVHIIFITAAEEYYEKFRGQHFPELGKINYIQKPIGNEELVQIVDRIVANSITMD